MDLKDFLQQGYVNDTQVWFLKNGVWDKIVAENAEAFFCAIYRAHIEHIEFYTKRHGLNCAGSNDFFF